MANFLVSLFQQLDRAFPLQGVDVAQHNNQRVSAELQEPCRKLENSAESTTVYLPTSGLPMMGTTGLDVAELPTKQPDSHWFDLPLLPEISPTSGLLMLENLDVGLTQGAPFQTHNFE